MKPRGKYNGLGETNYAKDAHFQIQVVRKKQFDAEIIRYVSF